MDRAKIEIRAKECSVSLRTDSEQWLDVKWEIKNSGTNDYYVLVKGFLSLSMKDLLLIDHTTSSGSYKIDAHVNPVVKFEKLESEALISVAYRYPLPHLNMHGSGEMKVVGKFSVSEDKPDPEWTNASYWRSIERWENTVFSSEFIITG